MNYFSLERKSPEVGFEEAVRRGLAPDRGLYFPNRIEPLAKSFFDNLHLMDSVEIAFQAIKQFVGAEIPEVDLRKIIAETLAFEFPLVHLEEQIYALELYHGPTLAFKDVGARFMARCLGYFNDRNTSKESVSVLVATSGDTGSAVANGFYKVPGVDVIILYPSGKVSEIQEKQLTTLGENITAIEVHGTFDDCQHMVKRAFLDHDFDGKRQLTSANSINVARWLPQMFYYFLAFKEVKLEERPIVFSVPSGNFGNICAGMMAQQLGLPIHHFVTGTNANDVIPNYLRTGTYEPKPSVPTISNAMDVGAPSNFVRIQEIHNGSFEKLKQNLSGYGFTDAQTREAMEYLYTEIGYIADPHGAIGYLALKEYQRNEPETLGIFLETAHPVKFLDVIPKSVQESITIPKSIKSVLSKKKKAEMISTYDELKQYLLSN